MTVGTGEKDILGAEALGTTVTVGLAVGVKDTEALGLVVGTVLGVVVAVAVGEGLVLPGFGTKESSQPVVVQASSVKNTAAGFLRSALATVP
jgi:hypothetical protein